MDTISLDSHGKILDLVIHKRSWCEIYLQTEDGKMALGGNSLELVITKLLYSFMFEKDRSYFSYQNMELFTVVNLMGPHAVVAAREKGNNEIEFMFLSNNGEIIPMLTLSEEKMKEWINIVVCFLVKSSCFNK